MCVNRHSEKIALCVTVLTVLFTAIMVGGESMGIRKAHLPPGYETRLFDTSRIHEINVIMDNWEDFLITCENKLYSDCSVIIDGERLDNVGIRVKGNSSLVNVRAMNSQRYGLKLEFDHYQTGKTYHGLDKLSLNNLIHDNTYMKDYLTFRLMDEFGVASPLCSYVALQINGEPWGLFLASEGIEESFLQRNYGSVTGVLYKPDSMGFGGEFGSGRNLRMEDLENGALSNMPPPPVGGNGFPQLPMDGNGLPAPPPLDENGFLPTPPDMSSEDVMLQYIDDNPNSYANIFGTAKTYVTPAARARLIRALRTLSESLEHGKNYLAYQAVYDEDVIRYFVVHNYVVNGDSYTGGMVHNYYLYEDAGRLRMFPWDYNLGFGNFQNQDASAAVNDPMDTPLSVSGDGSRPMADWILQDMHINNYHMKFAEFLQIDVQKIIDEAYQVIAPVVASDEVDPTHFCSRKEFEAGVKTLRKFCELRSKSLRRQLSEDIPSTKAGQAGAKLIDASGLDLSAMGSMGGAF